ncbi:MAG: radical SAM protein [Chitinivibrionales bacterium]|nr:radical SAM protein [Chitinivibrionales bacterium]MBD3396548.1 radical SAM protein [Chitinivibrionales bacterium]
MISSQEFLTFFTRYFAGAIVQSFRGPRLVPQLLSRIWTFIRIVQKGEKLRACSERGLSMPVPRNCVFSVTWKCNLDCTGCYARNYSVKQQMPAREIARVLKECADMGIYIQTIAGGEPFMVEGLLEKVAAIKNAFFLFYTNGTLLTPDHVRVFSRARNIMPVVSIEGSGPQTDIRRGTGVHEKVLSAMGKLKRAHVPFAFSTMVTHENVMHVTSREWVSALWDRGARFGFFIDYIPMPKNLNTAYVLTAEDRRCKDQAIKARNAEARPLLFNLPPDEYESGECLAAGKGLIHINADGFVEPCPFSHYAIDNIKSKSIPEILGSSFFKELRQKTAEWDNPLKECMLFRHHEKVRELAQQTGASWTEV